MKFRVLVKREDGTEEKRVVEAESRFAVYEEVEKEKGSVLTLEEGTGFSFSIPTEFTIGTGIKNDEKIVFTKNLAAMLFAGLSLPRALSVIERQSSNKALKKIVVALGEHVKKGGSFHEGLEMHRKVFSELFIAMTRAGEESGKLSDALKVVAQQMDRSSTLQKKVKGAMIYPGIILSAIVVIGILLLIYVVPTLSATFVSLNVQLPLATRIIVATSNFMASHVILVFLIVGALFGGGMFFAKSKIGSALILRVALHVPVIGELVKETFSARAARSLSSLLSSGVDMLQALKIAQEVVGAPLFARVLKEAEEGVRKGEALSTAFSKYPNLYPVFVGDMISVGEETGRVADMLSQVAEYYETDVEDRTKDLSTIIEPVLMLIIGVVVGVFAISMISPIYSLSSKI